MIEGEYFKNNGVNYSLVLICRRHTWDVAAHMAWDTFIAISVACRAGLIFAYFNANRGGLPRCKNL